MTIEEVVEQGFKRNKMVLTKVKEKDEIMLEKVKVPSIPALQ